MTNWIRAALIAPAPIFLFMLMALVRPSLGWTDVRFSVGIAVACSYGFMIMAGLPAHLLLRRLGWQSWTNYVFGFVLALSIVVIMLTAVEGPPPPPLPDDNSPFATFTLRSGGWMFMFAVCSPLAAVMGSMFWHRAVRNDETCR